MITEIVHTILSLNFVKSLFCKERSYANKENFRRRRNGFIDKADEQNESTDNVKTHKIKRQCNKITFKVPLLASFLLLYICVFNVIILCDVSVNNVNMKTLKHEHDKFKKDKGLDYVKRRRNLDEKSLESIDKRTTDNQDENNDETSDKYSMSEVLELNKYYTYYKQKENNTNDSQYANTIQVTRNVIDDTKAVGRPHDLSKNPYFVKKTNFQLRPQSHQFNEKIVKLGVLLPEDPTQVFSLAKVLPIVEMAVPAVTRPDGPLPGWKILVDYRDTRCSSVEGPLAAFEFYVNGSADAFIGPGCEYVIAPVARYAGLWRIPVLTPGAQAEAFGYKIPSYMSLTRMMGSYTQAGDAIRKVFEEFSWRRLSMLYHNNDPSTGKGNSPCFMTLSAVFTVLQKKTTDNILNIAFDETNVTTTKIKKLLKKLSLSTRIVVVCANPSIVREIMLAADDLNMVSSGEYVFFNIELFSNLASASSKEPWKVEGDTEERNERARRAYSAVLTVTSPAPEKKEYLEFSDKVKQLAETKYNYTFGKGEVVSTFVAAFYDAVLLYALALNDTLRQANDPRGELDGAAVIRNMWNRTFQGITGEVIINENGDRVASYSLLDMNPNTSKFEVSGVL
ncbi:unnamed protein product [Euphydryas editha]|uniref:Receptor ligand binding region domain-containing protein n=1 Tax=Euphydryas editha TaxID=104508 RepID=A0AAU9UBM1_EUPED|nr:unnamed protein product [Euphydryas editha]